MLDFFGTIGGAIMTPLYYAVSFILVGFHRGLTALGFDAAGGWTWILSIIGLTLVVRTALIPLFVKQIKSSRNMQLIQPKVRELQKKYGHDREKLAQETMKLYKDSGTNPFASCLPILLQMPIFLALFRMLDQAARRGKAHGFMDSTLAGQFRDATFLGDIKVSGTLTGGETGVMIVAGILVVAMTATTFMTQRQLMSKNMPADALSGPYAQQQKMLLYVLPVVFAVGGIAFPIGVLVYWTISNLWTMCQQFYVIRNNPAPGTPAAEAKEQRDRAKAEKKGLKTPAQLEEERIAAEADAKREEKASTRVQPQRQTKAQRTNKKKK
ncbi:YidC/Oxa1 family membrane protein insertase [Nocardioides exalbidus]|uniref:Membrane protein insertase YidC n=2 Tax=Nocardioides exalbidus TaxID=402596 RepID=A0A1H4P2T5_9ACTN|nr:membrane protein insertase YidC [Nocardioides exalbidus]SEC01816.1 YidC/Oxa1 family membrane protein insertase [Nocardioides exalbidus]